MSTNINISVGDNKLLDQARLQQNASRQAQLEKEANQRLQTQAIDTRTKQLAAQGLDANGNPITGASLLGPQLERRPAANRQTGAGVCATWRDLNFVTQSSITYKASDKTLCSIAANNGGFSLSRLDYTLFSGDGSTKLETQIQPQGALTQNFSPPNNPFVGNLQDYFISLGWDYGPLYSYLVSPANGLEVAGLPNAQILQSVDLWLPLGSNLGIFYSYISDQSALQFISQQTFTDCSTLSTATHYWGATSPQYFEQETEICYIISKDTVTSISPPAQLKPLVKQSLSTYTYTSIDRFILVGDYYNGDQVIGSSLAIPSWTWTITPATNPNIFDGNGLKYTATSPVTGSTIRPGSAGIYKTLVADPSTNYTVYENKATQITNKNTATGFIVGQDAAQMYAGSSVFLHEKAAGEKNTFINKLALAANRLPTTSSLRMYISYDWGDSSFCRSQLLKLGFSPSDLVP